MEGSTIITNENEEPVVDSLREYDPNSMERICCVELPNNNHICIRYLESSTIKDVILKYITFL